MICPRCRSGSCRRSRRRGPADYVLGLSGLRPWRCRACELRFRAWSVPPRYVLFVHCSRCGNMDLQHISRSHVTEGTFPGLWRSLGVPAYRCQPCRYRFFSLRPRLRINPPADVDAEAGDPSVTSTDPDASA